MSTFTVEFIIYAALITSDLLVCHVVSQPRYHAHSVQLCHILSVVKDALNVEAKFFPLIFSTLLAEIHILPSPEYFYLLYMVENVPHVYIK